MTDSVGVSQVVVARRGHDSARSIVATVVLVVSSVLLVGVATVVVLEDWGTDDPFTACPDPDGALYNAGRPRWSNWPPGSYCDYRNVHPEWSEPEAIRGRPSAIRGVLLITLPPMVIASMATVIRQAGRKPSPRGRFRAHKRAQRLR